MAIGRSLRAALASVVPTWLANLPGFRNLYAYCWSIALLGDCLREIAWEGQLAAYPGVGTPTALPYIGQSRGLTQGPSEANANFAARCIAFRDAWARAGSAESICEQIQSFLVGIGNLGAGVYPVVRIVDRQGNAVTRNADQSFSYSTISWDWDELGGFVDDRGWRPPAQVDTWWADIWVLIQDPFTHWTGFSDVNWLAAWNTGDQTIDAQCPQSIVQAVLTLISTFKGEHSWVRAVVFAPNPTTVSPSGYWGNASHNFTGVQTAQRTASFSYWTPAGGG